MTIHYQDDTVAVHAGDCLDVLRELPDASIDAVVTDPPYGLEFMGKDWDKFDRAWRADSPEVTKKFTDSGGGGRRSTSPVENRPRFSVMDQTDRLTFQAWCETWARECLRVLKPGGHLLAFGGTRTSHRLTCGIEDAGFEIRDGVGSGSYQLAWVYGSGFPKSRDIGKAIDSEAGAEREVIGTRPDFVAKFAAETRRGVSNHHGFNETHDPGRGGYVNPETVGQITAPATDAAQQWDGWGTALKPAWEPIVVARKPLAEGTVAANVLRFGTGALNIAACRIGTEEITAHGGGVNGGGRIYAMGAGIPAMEPGSNPHAGRWPANVVLDGRAAAALDAPSGETKYLPAGRFGTQHGDSNATASVPYGARKDGDGVFGYGDRGGASRYFHVTQDDTLPLPIDTLGDRFRYVPKADASERPRVDGAAHPTVKPLDLMRWLVRLVTPPGGLVLDPFAGSGATVEACIVEGFRCTAIEREPDYLPLIEARITRRRDPIRNIELTGGDLGLFSFDGE